MVAARLGNLQATRNIIICLAQSTIVFYGDIYTGDYITFSGASAVGNGRPRQQGPKNSIVTSLPTSVNHFCVPSRRDLGRTGFTDTSGFQSSGAFSALYYIVLRAAWWYSVGTNIVTKLSSNILAGTAMPETKTARFVRDCLLQKCFPP